MARLPSETLTQRETEIMQVLWQSGLATADQVRRALPEKLHDSTVRTLLRILVQKGYVARTTGNEAMLYRPVVAKAKVQQLALRSLLGRLFAGCAGELVMRMIEDEHLTVEQLDDLRRAVRKQRRKNRS